MNEIVKQMGEIRRNLKEVEGRYYRMEEDNKILEKSGVVGERKFWKGRRDTGFEGRIGEKGN